MLLEILYAALREEYGVVVETNDPALLRQQLYPLRNAHLDEFECLSFKIDPLFPDVLWVVKKEAQDATDD